MSARASHKQGQGQGSITPVRKGCTCRKAEGRHDVWRVRAPVLGYTEKGSPIQPGETVHGLKADALEKLDELRGAKRAGRLTTSTDTVAEFLERWVEVSSARWSPSTTRRNKGTVKVLTDALGGLRLRDLKAGNLAALYAAETTRGQAASSVRRLHAVIARALTDAVAWGELGTSPAPAARSARPRVTIDGPRPMTNEEVDALLTAAATTGPMWPDLFEVAASTGLRRGELVALQWQDVDTEAREVVVRHSIDYTNRAAWSLVPPKSRRVRRVPLTETAAEALDRQFSRASSTAPGAFIFSEVADGATPIDPDRISKVAREARDAAGIPADVKPVHALRAYFLTVVGSEVSAREAQALAGHASIVTTERYLGRVRDDTAKAVAALDRARGRKALPA